MSDPLAEAPDQAFNTATRVLEGLGFVGITEKFDVSLAALAGRLGIEAPVAGGRANIAEENHTDPSGWFRLSQSVERSSAVDRALQRRTRLDRALYARAFATSGATLVGESSRLRRAKLA